MRLDECPLPVLPWRLVEKFLPPYSHRFSPQRFTQPQLLAILYLMRYEDLDLSRGGDPPG